MSSFPNDNNKFAHNKGKGANQSTLARLKRPHLVYEDKHEPDKEVLES